MPPADPKCKPMHNHSQLDPCTTECPRGGLLARESHEQERAACPDCRAMLMLTDRTIPDHRRLCAASYPSRATQPCPGSGKPIHESSLPASTDLDRVRAAVFVYVYKGGIADFTRASSRLRDIADDFGPCTSATYGRAMGVLR
jgi:hypothetical protein